MKKAIAILGTWALALTGGVAMTAQRGSTQVPLPFTALPAQQLAGYSTGTDVHLHVLQQPTSQLVHAEVAFTGATVASQGTNTRPAYGPNQNALAGEIVNEFGQVVQPILPVGTNPPQLTPPESPTLLTGDTSFARGS